jgi:acetyltransferase-like isoleucine patch superfamily enzyme
MTLQQEITDRLRLLAQTSNISIGFANQQSFSSALMNPDVDFNVRDGAIVLCARETVFANRPKITVTGTASYLVIDYRARVEGTIIEIKGRGCGVYIGPESRLRRGHVKVCGSNCHVVFGAKGSWESGVILCSQDSHILIGNDFMFSNGIFLRTDDGGHGIFDRTTKECVNTSRSIYICPRVWIGNGARVNKGAYIGEGCILGGGSVASGSLEPHSIYAGVPARKIKGNVSWSRTYSWSDIPEAYR